MRAEHKPSYCWVREQCLVEQKLRELNYSSLRCIIMKLYVLINCWIYFHSWHWQYVRALSEPCLNDSKIETNQKQEKCFGEHFSSKTFLNRTLNKTRFIEGVMTWKNSIFQVSVEYQSSPIPALIWLCLAKHPRSTLSQKTEKLTDNWHFPGEHCLASSTTKAW